MATRPARVAPGDSRWLGLALAGLLLACSPSLTRPAGSPPLGLCGEPAEAACASALAEDDVVTLTVRVELGRRGGAPPGPMVPTPVPAPRPPLAGATVQVYPAESQAAPVAEGVSDAAGQVQFDRPPGRYWVAVPWASQPGVPAGSAAGGNLPDSRPVLAWAEVMLADSAPADVTLVVTLALP